MLITGLGQGALITGFPIIAGGSVVLPDTVAPVVTAFNLLSGSDQLTVPITLLAATDQDAYGNPGVIAGWWLSENPATPAVSASGWKPAKPTFYTFATAGQKTLWCYVKDASGNISRGKAATTTIILSGPSGNIDLTATTRVYTLQTDGQIFTLTKQPTEVLVGVGIDFRRFLARGEQIGVASCTGATIMRFEGTTAFCAIAGGVSGETLRVTLTGRGDKGSVVEGELKVVIKEV